MPRKSFRSDSDTPLNVIQVSSDYDSFRMIVSNRQINRGHVELIKKAFEENGNFTSKNPILVNEHYEIIDGQHRFVACKELGLPIYFTMQDGLNISDARAMNILHRSWNLVDYAQSYADAGNQNYVRFLTLVEDYSGFSYSVLSDYARGVSESGSFAAFRKGEFTFDDVASARVRLDELSEITDLLGTKDGKLCKAYLKVLAAPGFNHSRMMRKMQQVGEQIVRRYGSISEYLRAFEEVYNYQMGESNRLRLY